MKKNWIYNNKASEIYYSVNFKYSSDLERDWYIPIKNRRDGTDFEDSEDSVIKNYIEKVKKICKPENWETWRKEQDEFWKDKNSEVTKPIFDLLSADFSWVPVNVFNNPNYARRIQDLKDSGYTVVSGVKRFDKTQNKKISHVLLLPLPRGGINGYEQWDENTRKRILETLNYFDVYECKKIKNGLLPDHKFPEIRWDENTKRSQKEIANMSTSQIKKDFQLINNQRNQQKREVCRKCYQTNERGIIYGINYFYQGNQLWDKGIPKRGKVAERGCIGCGWYDIEEWRNKLSKTLRSNL